MLARWRESISRWTIPSEIALRIPLFLQDGACLEGARLVTKLVVHPNVDVKIRSTALANLGCFRNSAVVNRAISGLPLKSLNRPVEFVGSVHRLVRGSKPLIPPVIRCWMYSTPRVFEFNQLSRLDEMRLAALNAGVNGLGSERYRQIAPAVFRSVSKRLFSNQLRSMLAQNFPDLYTL
jgi:hypothetical protein